MIRVLISRETPYMRNAALYLARSATLGNEHLLIVF